MKLLAVIPARGGSKGLPGKNIRPLCGKPLICYAIDTARSILQDMDICVSTDSMEIKEVVENYGLKVLFLRPESLATDTATTNDVLLHALSFYEQMGRKYEAILLLQPTTPLRTDQHIKEAVAIFEEGMDMVMAVKMSHAAAVLCHENGDGILESTLAGKAMRRQDTKTYYEINGAVYVISVKSLKEKGLADFDQRIKYVMPAENSVDIDSLLDFEIAEFILTKGLVKLR